MNPLLISVPRPGPWAQAGDLTAYLKRVPDPALLADLEEELVLRFMLYFYACPPQPDRPLSLKSRLLGLYDPFARRDRFPAGRRLCCNVYTGCAHGCRYCYTCGYIWESRRARAKPHFLRDLQRDLADLQALALPPLPLHISNSTDPLQEGMESQHGHTRALLRRLVENQGLFTTITLLTKNPARLIQPDYLDCLQGLERVCVEVSLIFWEDTPRAFWEPESPSVASRLNAIQGLRAAGVPVALRVDPLFPRNPLPREFFAQARVEDYGARSAHSWEDLRRLLDFAAETGCVRAIVSPLKVPCGRWQDPAFRSAWQSLYAAANGGSPRVKSFAYRLPETYVQEHLIGPVQAYGLEVGLPVVHCKRHLITTL
jgi:DNA repair photolyase